uniref:Translocase of outer mitochondrial membrane 20 n=1 Tax=Takifugu rubripes TaxID=31033 RepID=A0A674N2P8_TAKRU
IMSGRTSAVVVGACGALLVAYCIYFDRKRRNEPHFKEKLRERKLPRQPREPARAQPLTVLPDLKDPEAVQRFFLQEIQLGEEHLAAGELETGVDHLTNAIAVCEQPQKLLQVLQQTLPPPVFQMMLSRLPAVGQRIASSRWLTEEDVE